MNRVGCIVAIVIGIAIDAAGGPCTPGPYYPDNSAQSIGVIAQAGSRGTPSTSAISAGAGQWADCSGYWQSFPPILANSTGAITICVVLESGPNQIPNSGCAYFDHQLDSDGKVIGGTIRIYDKDSQQNYCFASQHSGLIAHELGHVLGLGNAPDTAECETHIMGRRPWTTSPQSDECDAANDQWTTTSEQQQQYCMMTCWTACQNGDCPPFDPVWTPILLDIDENGFHLVGIDDAVLFDLDADGQHDRITWTARGAGDAFLALDRNRNGTIDDGRELFGNATQLSNGAAAPNGYVALAEFDTESLGGNGDGLISESDAIWEFLRVWIDTNHDAVSQPHELTALPESRVVALQTNYVRSNHRDQYGNVFRFKGKAYVRNGPGKVRVAVTYDVFFRQ